MPKGRSYRFREGGNSNPSRNRPVRTRTPGCVGPVAGLAVSHGDPIRVIIFCRFPRVQYPEPHQGSKAYARRSRV
jgi:hypothetical protein